MQVRGDQKQRAAQGVDEGRPEQIEQPAERRSADGRDLLGGGERGDRPRQVSLRNDDRKHGLECGALEGARRADDEGGGEDPFPEAMPVAVAASIISAAIASTIWARRSTSERS